MRKLIQYIYIYKLSFWSAFVIILLITYLPLFAHLDETPIQVWDEMRNAQNALEMNRTGRIILTTFDGVPETWNTKPPLMIWIQALSQRWLGYNELAVRFPSALSGLLTCLTIAGFCRKQLGSWLPGILAVLVLVTIPAYVDTHGTRTGDFDALLVFFLTASVCSVANFVQSGNGRWIYASAVALTLAVLTKGIAGLLVCPAILLYVLSQRKFLRLIKSKEFFIGATFFLVVVGGFYALREMQQPGYWSCVLENEIFGRYGKSIETHEGPFLMYFDSLRKWASVPWHLLIIPALISGIFSKDECQRRIILLSGIASISLLLVVSAGQTKLIWYVLPVYPFVSIMCGVLLYQSVTLLGRIKISEQIWRVNILPLLFLIAVFWTPYEKIVDQSMNGLRLKGDPPTYDAACYFQAVIDGRQNLDGNVLCGDAYFLKWYKSIIEGKGLELKEINKENLQIGQKVYVWEDGVKNFVRDKYQVEQMGSLGSLTLYRVHAVKSSIVFQ